MKKALIMMLTSLFLLAGCSTSSTSTESYDSDQFVKDMKVHIEQENQNVSLKENIDKKNSELLNLFPDKNNIPQGKQLLSEAKKFVAQYKQAVQKLQGNISDLKAKVAKMEDKQNQKKAEEVVTNFTNLTNTEMEIANNYDQLFDNEVKFWNTVGSGESLRDVSKSGDVFRDKLIELKDKYTTELNTLKKSLQ